MFSENVGSLAVFIFHGREAAAWACLRINLGLGGINLTRSHVFDFSRVVTRTKHEGSASSASDEAGSNDVLHQVFPWILFQSGSRGPERRNKLVDAFNGVNTLVHYVRSDGFLM